jgi:outer membrane protein OmpA-like peptidoglycan-associated protein
MIRDGLSENNLFAWERYQKDIIEDVQEILFSRQVRNLYSALGSQQQILQQWQVKYQQELRALLTSEVETQIIRQTRDPLESYIRNLLTIKTSQERVRNIESSINKLIQLQRSIEADILDHFGSDQVVPSDYADTITLVANFALQQDIYLHTTLVDTKTTLQNIFFSPNSPDLVPSAYPDLDRLAKLLLASPSLQVEMEVHTNTSCTYLFAQNLTEARAETLRNYLLQKGVTERQVLARGSGKLHPLEIGDSTQIRKTNQRVELRFSTLKNQ